MTKIRMLAHVVIVAGVTVAGLVHAQDAEAQLPRSPVEGASVRSREDLEELLQFYEDALMSTAYSEEVRASLAVEAERVRTRLRDGDFRPGDRIVVSVQGETSVPDTVAVQSGPMISLGLFGDVALQGVLRSEVEDRIRETVSAFVRNPVVSAEGLMRVSVQGAVSAPGFYVVPADVLLSEALMVAGGPTQTADLEGLRVERGVEVLIEGADLQEALRAGLSLDQLNMQAGDQVVLPQETTGSDFSNVAVNVGLLASITLIIVQVAG